MAWIELHQTLPDNKKILRLKSALSLKTPAALGHMCLLWLWAIDNARDGDLSAFSPKELAEVCQFNLRRADEFLNALVHAGFLDREGESLRIHDWEEYTGKLNDLRESRRRADRERQRRRREKLRDERDESVTVTLLPNQTIPNQTEPNQTSFSGDGDGARAVAEYVKLRGSDPNDYFGAAAVMDEVRDFSRELFRRFVEREPTGHDIEEVFFSVTRARRNGDEIERYIDENARDLLMYAFEAAARAGQSGSWPYVDGVLRRLGERGIKTLDNAEDYELEHNAARL